MEQWYYEQEHGKVSAALKKSDLELLIKEGKINAKTLVWKEGFSVWQPLEETELSSFLSL